MLLPKKVGSFTLMRRLDGGRNSEAYVAILEEPAGKQVVARRVAPAIARDPSQRAFIESRVRDLMTVRHPSLVPVLDAVATDTDLWVLEEWSESVSLRTVIKRASREKLTMPHNVFLNVATQICNGLEALHGRRAATTGAEHILHLALSPEAVRIDPSGRVQLGRFGLTRSPIPNSGSSTNQDVSDIVRYLSPEQTQPDPRLSPASDIFSLGIVLYELLVLKAMFEAEGTLQIIQQIRRAEVTTQLLEVKEALPGLDRVLFRALSLNPRHRYQRAFVLREDLRGLMAGFSFADIDEVSRAFFGPVFVEDDRLSDDFGESTPTHVGPLPEVKKRPDLRPKTFAPEFDEEPPPRPPKPPEERLSARATPRPAPQAPNRTPPKSAPVQRAPTPRPTPAKRAAPAAPPASRSVPQPPARSARPAPPRMAPPLQSAVAEDEEPTIGPGSLTLETLKEQLSFDDVHRRPLDDDERLLFENSDTHVGRDDERGDDAPTEFARVVRDDAGGFVVENGLGAPVVSPEPAWSGEPSFTNGEDAADPDSWNPRADVEPNVDWKDRPAWRGGPGPLDQGLGETQDPVTMTTRGHTGESPGFRDSAFNNPLGTTDFENFVDEDEVDTREHAATLWEREGTDEEPADDPATAWKPGLALEDSIRVFDDPTFDAGVDAGFDGVEEVNDDATMNLPRAAELPSGGFGNDPAPLGRSAPPLPPRDFAATDDPQDRTMEARSPLPELPPRSMSRSPSSAFPIDPAVPSSPPNGRGGTLVPPSFDERPSGFEPAPVPIGNPAMQEPTAQLRDFSPREAPGPSREDILRGRLVSDDVEDEDAEAGISWRVVFAAVAVMGFIGAVSVVGIVVYVAQQPFAQELFAVGAPHGDNEAFEVVERFDDPPEEAEPAPEEAEPEAAAEDEEVEVEAKLAEIAAEAVVKTELDPSQTFEGMKELDPEPVPAPAPPPPPPP
ncbi:MAG: protein kinase, partial [Myxococcota bacterium]